jgi:photosystem II stability/assembly factor-like uncharacterized protein
MTRLPHTDDLVRGGVLTVLIAAALAVSSCGTGITPPVFGPPPAFLTVSPDTLTLVIGGNASFDAAGRDSMGNVVTGFRVTWSSTDTVGAVISLSSGGRVTAVGEGTATVYAQSGTARDSGIVIVGPAQDGWYAQTSNANGATLNGVFFLSDGRRGWAVGEAGKILATADAGASWSVQTSGTAFNLNGVWFTGPLEGWAVGASGTVLHTTDGGADWNRILNTGASESLMDVYFANRDMGWIVGSAGVILKTRNRGASWQTIHRTGFTLNSVAFTDTTHGWAVGDNGVTIGTHDGGTSWFIVQPGFTSNHLKGVWRRSEQRAWAAGMQGVTPRTVAGPDSTEWELRNTGAANQLEGIHFPTDAIGFAVGWNGVGLVLRSTNSGQTWSAQTANTQFRLNDVFFVDANRGWAVGANGTILHTGSGGE